MPSDEEFRELKDQVASLTSALATARRRIDDLEDGMADHLGLDWGESLVDVNSPHPNISANTIESGGGTIRQDLHGMQIATQGSTLVGLYMVDELRVNPADGVTNGMVFEALIDDSAGQANFALKTIAATGNDSTGLSLSSTEGSNAEASLRATYDGSNAVIEAVTASTYRLIRLTGASFAVTSVLSPSQITTNQNDYDPTGLVNVFALRLTTDASRDITGINPGPLPTNRQLYIFNVGSFNIVLKDESASSTAANRFALQGDITIPPDGAAILLYDDTSSRWRCAGNY